MEEKYNANNESLFKLGFALCISPLFLAILFPSISNIPSMTGFHLIECQGILKIIVFLLVYY